MFGDLKIHLSNHLENMIMIQRDDVEINTE